MSTEVGKLVYELQLKIHAQVVLRRKSDFYVLIMFIPLRLCLQSLKSIRAPKILKIKHFQEGVQSGILQKYHKIVPRSEIIVKMFSFRS